MPIDLIFLNLLRQSQLVRVSRVFVRPRAVIFLILFAISFLLFSLNSFLCSDNFPFHLESILPQNLILRIGQVDSDLATIEYVEVAGSRDDLPLCLCV